MNRATNARTRLVEHLKRTNQKKVRTTSGRYVCLVGNGGQQPIEWSQHLDLAEIEKLYPEFIVTEKSIDHKLVRQALEAGDSLPFAKLLERGKHVEFKTK